MKKSNYQILKEIVDDHIRKTDAHNDNNLALAQAELDVAIREMKDYERFKSKVDRCHDSYVNTQRSQSQRALDEKKKEASGSKAISKRNSVWRKGAPFPIKRDVDAHIKKEIGF